MVPTCKPSMLPEGLQGKIYFTILTQFFSGASVSCSIQQLGTQPKLP